jgi:TonB family protein
MKQESPMMQLCLENRGGNSGTRPGAFLFSLGIQGGLVAILMLVGTTQVLTKPATQLIIITPPPVFKPLPIKMIQSGGGGQRSPLPPIKGELPKPAPKAFVPPLATIEHPALVMDASLIAAPDAWAAPTSAIGNPLGAFNGGGGLGPGGGLGNGPGGTGIGDHTGPGRDAGIFTVGHGVTNPEPITRVEPEYSEEARKAKYSGTVLLSFVVNTDGSTSDFQVERSLGMGLDQKAIEAVGKWRFRPGTSKGVPVRVRAEIVVTFRLL